MMKERNSILVGLTLSCIAVFALFFSAARYSSAKQEVMEKIAFVSNRDDPNFEIYIMDVDGSNVKRLTDHPAEDWSPAWSPDGERIAFVSNRDGRYNIYVMDSDGSNVKRLTDKVNAWGLAWSPNGRKIAFDSDHEGNSEIYVMNADGSNMINLTNNIADDFWPTWSPDGKKIAFDSNRDWNSEIYIMDSDGRNPINISRNPMDDCDPAWSPDGKRIAFESRRAFRGGDIYIMNFDGQSQKKLTNAQLSGTIWPAWSPDGSKIAFTTWPKLDFNGEVYVMDVNGKNMVNLTKNPAEDYVEGTQSWWSALFSEHAVGLFGKYTTTWGEIKLRR